MAFKAFGRAFASLVIVLSLSGALRAGDMQRRPLVLAYLWGGQLQSGEGLQRFDRSARFLLAHGFDGLRVTVTRGTARDYDQGGAVCGIEPETPCLMNRMLSGPAFDDPALKMLMVTLHEAAAVDVLKGSSQSVRVDALKEELRQDLDILRQRFAGRAVKVVVTNWEGDNQVYCGGVFQYARNRRVADDCNGGSNGGVDQRLARFMTWMRARDETVEAFRSQHPGFDVTHAPEFNLAYLGPLNCKTDCDPRRTVFEALRQQGRRGLCSFSSYNSTNRRALNVDLGRIGEVCDEVVLGETGFNESTQGPVKVRAGFEQVAEAIGHHAQTVPAIVIWNAFNPGVLGEKRFGLFEPDGRPANVRWLPPVLAPQPRQDESEPAPSAN